MDKSLSILKRLVDSFNIFSIILLLICTSLFIYAMNGFGIEQAKTLDFFSKASIKNTIYASKIYISAIYELQKIGNDPEYPINGDYELLQDIDASVTISWNSSSGFAPIGTKDNPFTGRFDGNGYEIRGLYINRPLDDYVGLFGYVGEGGEINNLSLENVEIIGYDSVGSIVAWNDGGSVVNCYSTGLISGNAGVGGLVGNNLGTISTSYTNMTVLGRDVYVGGVVGWNMGFITQCFSLNWVTGVDTVGGLVGGNDGGSITNSFSTGATSGRELVGGFVGENSASISQCYSTGIVYGYGDYVGGLVGWNSSPLGVSYSYWNTDTSNQNNSSGGVGKTTSQMKQQATYNGWDFTNIWGIENGNTYPYLKNISLYMPDLVGMHYDFAQGVIVGSAMSLGTISYKCDNNITENRIISQSIQPNAQIIPGQIINLVVSKGSCVIPMPNVVGEVWTNAQNIIKNANLNIGSVIMECNDRTDNNRVIRTYPEAGVGVMPGGSVDIVVSKGHCIYNFITSDIIGTRLDDIQQWIDELKNQGINVEVRERESNKPIGEILEQTPCAGTPIIPGMTVYIVVSSGGLPATYIPSPTWVRAGWESGKVIVRWEASRIPGEVRYKIQRQKEGSTNWEDLGESILPEYVDTDTIEGVDYKYRILVIGPRGETSMWSSEVGSSILIRVGKVNTGKLEKREIGRVQIPISISGVGRGYVKEIYLRLGFDSNKMKIDADKIWLMSSARGMNRIARKATGIVEIRLSGGNGILGSGPLLLLNATVEDGFLIDDDNPCIDIKVKEVILKKEEGKFIPAIYEDGQVCVKEDCMFGDVTRDWFVRDDDAKRILDAWAGLVARDDCMLTSGDINKDFLLDTADSSLIMRMARGLFYEVSDASVINKTKEIVWIEGGNIGKGKEIDLKIKLSDKKGLDSFELMLVYGKEFKLQKVEVGSDINTGNLKYLSISGNGYLQFSGILNGSLKTNGEGELLKIKLKDIGVSPSSCRLIDLRGVNLFGEDADDFRWYREIEVKSGQVCVYMTKEWFLGELQRRFNEVDTDRNGFISWIEASISYSDLTREVFDELDANKDGKISRAETGILISEGSNEGLKEGIKEGEIKEGVYEGTKEGIQEGLKENESIEPKGCGCGCLKKESLDNDRWLRYLFDFLFIGLLISFICGMNCRKGK